MEWCGMDSTGLAHEPVAEFFEIGNGPSGMTLDGEFPEQQLSEYYPIKYSVVSIYFKKQGTHPSLSAGSYFAVSPQEYQHITRALKCIETSKLFDNSQQIFESYRMLFKEVQGKKTSNSYRNVSAEKTETLEKY